MCRNCLVRAWGKNRDEIDDWLFMQRERPGAGAKALSRKAQGVECPRQGQPTSSPEAGEELEELRQAPRPAPAERGGVEGRGAQGGRLPSNERRSPARLERATGRRTTGHRDQDRSRDHGRPRRGEASRRDEDREGDRREDTQGGRTEHRSDDRTGGYTHGRWGGEAERREHERRTVTPPRRSGAQGRDEARGGRSGTTRTNWPREDVREDRERDDRHRRRSEEWEPWWPRKRGR